jgi:uncharacterized protein YraI
MVFHRPAPPFSPGDCRCGRNIGRRAGLDGGMETNKEIPVKRTFTTLSALLLSSIALPALAQDASVTTDLNMRAGPGTQYPVITTIPGGRSVDIYGCEGGLNWCDVSWRGNRGWVYSDYLSYTSQNRTRPVAEWGARLDLPIVSFSFGDYADRHYRGMPWYDDRDRWDRDRGGRWDRDDRDRDRGGRWDHDDRDRDRDRDRWGRGDRDRDDRRDRGDRDRGGARGNWMDGDPWDRGNDRIPTNRDGDSDLWEQEYYNEQRSRMN